VELAVARKRALVTRPLLEAGIAVISSSRRVGDRRRVPLPYLVGGGGQRHRQRWLRRWRRRQGEEVAMPAPGLVVVVVEICRWTVASNLQCAQFVDGGGGGGAHGGRVHQAEQRVRGRRERVRVPGVFVHGRRRYSRSLVLMINGCGSRAAGRRKLLPRRRRRLACRGVFRDGRRRRALAVEEVQLVGRSCGWRGRGRRRRGLLGVLLRRGGAGGSRARRGRRAAVVDAGALVHAAKGDFSLQI
jgi:hypothetical protein